MVSETEQRNGIGGQTGKPGCFMGFHWNCFSAGFGGSGYVWGGWRLACEGRLCGCSLGRPLNLGKRKVLSGWPLLARERKYSFGWPLLLRKATRDMC